MHSGVKTVWREAMMALFFAWGDTKARYRRSTLGPFWIVLGTAVGVAGLGFLWSTLLKTDKSVMIPSITIGLILWQYLAGCITECPILFFKHAMIVRNIKTPFLFFPLHLLMRHTINFAHNLVVIFAVLLIYPPEWSWIQLLAIPGIALVFFNLLWIALFLGMLGARFRDLELLISAFIPMLFFLTPVIYRPDHLGLNEAIVWVNPFAYLITVVREPLLGTVPDLFVYAGAVAMLVVGWTMALLLLKRRRHRLAFWV